MSSTLLSWVVAPPRLRLRAGRTGPARRRRTGAAFLARDTEARGRIKAPVRPGASRQSVPLHRRRAVDVLARIASQGRVGGEGSRAALYALYLGESEVGLYGLEAASPADAGRLEGVLRGIWAHNESLGRARVHRKGKVLVVAWHNGVSPSCWEAVNPGVVERLTAP